MVFGLSAGLLTVIAIIAVIALIGLSIGIVNSIGNTFIDVAIAMPKLESTNNNANITMYTFFRDTSFYILAMAITLAGISLMLEQFNILAKNTASMIISKSMLLVILLFAFPIIWDNVAYMIEEFSKYILSPDNPARANEKVRYLWENISAISTPSIPDPFELLDPSKLSERLFVDVFMSVFKSLIAFMLMVSLYLIGTIRIVLTAVLIIGLPIILMLSLIPFLKRISDILLNTLIGLSIAPILSSLTVTAGSAYLSGSNLDHLQLWIASVAIASLAVYFPTLLAPMLGSLVTSLSAWVTGAGVSSVLLASGSVAGVAKGAITGISTISSGLGTTLGREPNALELARAVTSASGMRMMGRSVLSGLAAGTIGGLLTSLRPTTEALGIPSVSRFTDNAARSTLSIASDEAKDNAMELVRNFAGSLIEGSIAYYALKNPLHDVNTKDVNRWFYTIKSMYDKQEYEALARFANRYFKLPDEILKGKEGIFGKTFGEHIMNIAKADDKRPLTNLYYWLEQIRERGGISKIASADELKSIIRDRDVNRERLGIMHNITLPNPNFEIIDLTIHIDEDSNNNDDNKHNK